MTLIKVTAEDIGAGIRGDCDRCPIVLAALRVFPLAAIMVTKSKMYVDEAMYKLPAIAKAFIHSFDRRFPVTPFEFEV